MQSPNLDNCAAVAVQTSPLRAEMYVLTPFVTNPSAIILPIPREPPVTKAVLPETSKRFFMIEFLNNGKSEHHCAVRIVILNGRRRQ
jgi:hypothetical protein